MADTALLDSFTRHLRAKNRSAGTIDSYRADARHLLDHLGGTVELEDVTRPQIEDFLAACLDRGLADATVARRFRSLQQLFKWMATVGEIDTNPMAAMTPPTVAEQPPEVLTAGELTALLKACREREPHGRSGPYEAKRDTAMVLLLSTTGVRASELIGMNVDDVRFDTDTFRVIGKGRRGREVTLLPRPAEAVDTYLRARRKHPIGKVTDRLWVGEKGPLTDSGLRQMLERRCEAAGIRKINPHLFRHTFAADAKRRGMSDESLMALAGWNTPQMLRRYGAAARTSIAHQQHRDLFGRDEL